ncbi:hypothetical protein QO034_21765 [Sedimentitalea sp. JM2-8]|uniref:DUF6538 domain-containing protein n=1 Tax=Sedimentitalea xiamensis TaxID=3050037 RepID=A0ABT7FKM7_9RHOB|nr:DUF6538 domain-containing protein [Sedimentitalea xiamensis]MDK3075698.1 hypothetical protein [Sedimentitalea xiamensis]
MVGHIMHLASYPSISRHGIFYFRFPLPVDRHPALKRSHIKVSLGTRDPRIAKSLARLLTIAGQSIVTRPMVRAMRYDEIREHVRDHFGQLLVQFRERSASNGPVNGLDMDALWAAQGLSDDDARLPYTRGHLSRSGKASTASSALEHALIARFGTLGRIGAPFC